PEPEAFHLLDKGALRVPAGRPGLVLDELDLWDRDGLADDEARHRDRVGFRVRIDPVPPRVGQELALALEPLTVDLHGAGPSDAERIGGERREEPTDHELVDRGVVGTQLLRV